jgi:hypothetical protein
MTAEEMKATHPSRTGSPAESLRLQRLLREGKAHIVDGRVVEETP